MLAIYKKEVKAYFSTMIGYAFIAFFTLVVGFVFYMINVSSAQAYVGFALQQAYVSIMFMVLVPVLTMKIFADERHSKTDQMLFTAPVTIGKIVAGKFFAVATVFSVPVLVTLVYPLVMMDYGKIPVGASYSAIFGFWMMGLAFFSIGIFISSITENQIISAVVTFAIILFSFMLQYMTGIFSGKAISSLIAICVIVVIFAIVYFAMARTSVNKAIIYAMIIAVVGCALAIGVYVFDKSIFEGLLQNLMLHLSLSYMYKHFFSTEVFDLASAAYFVSIIGFFIYMTVLSIQKRRWS